MERDVGVEVADSTPPEAREHAQPRTYERYSMTGGNRLTLSVSILAVGDRMEVALTTSGGSQGVFLKFNTFGEEAFMDKGLEAVEGFARG